jgi:hypothetical protein
VKQDEQDRLLARGYLTAKEHRTIVESGAPRCPTCLQQFTSTETETGMLSQSRGAELRRAWRIIVRALRSGELRLLSSEEAVEEFASGQTPYAGVYVSDTHE